MSFFKKLFGSKEEKAASPQKEDRLKPFKEVAWMTDLRLKNIKVCLDAGFKPTTSLPTELGRELRPSVEIAKRLSAIKALILWFMVPEENLPSEKLLAYIENNQLKDFMDASEKELLNLPRLDEEARNQIGWKFENAWPLAWYFGYKTPGIFGEMMSGEQMQEILKDYSCPLNEKVEEWEKTMATRSEDDLAQKEDLFYCLHNAVRSAQMGGDTIPPEFDPMSNGGVIHERRHALTWMMSEGVSWEETDLST